MSAEEKFHVPEHVHALVHDGGVVILDSNAGTYKALNSEGSSLLQAINEGSTESVFAHFALRHSDLPRGQAHNLAKTWLRTIEHTGLIVAGEGPKRQFRRIEPVSEDDLLYAGDIEMAQREVEEMTLSAKEHEAAMHGVNLALDWAKRPFVEGVKQIRDARAAATEEATAAEVLRTMAAVRKVSQWYPGRIACPEVSLATVFAIPGKRVDLQIGAGVDPIRFHMWPEVQGKPVRAETDEPIRGVYHPLYAITGDGQLL